MNNIQQKWDLRFLALAKHVAQWSKDPSTKVGAVLVSMDRKGIVVGYNGFPRLMADHDALYNDRPTKYSRVIHAETNAILNAGRSLVGWTLYTNPLPPCDRCAVLIIQSGIRRIVSPMFEPGVRPEWVEASHRAASYFKEANVLVNFYPLIFTPKQEV